MDSLFFLYQYTPRWAEGGDLDITARGNTGVELAEGTHG